MAIIEQRRSRRFLVNVPCLVKSSRLKKQAPPSSPVPAETVDISRSGLSFLCQAEWKVGTEIECEIELPREFTRRGPVKIHCRGKVVRVVPEGANIRVGARIEHFSYLRPSGVQDEIAG